MAKTIITAALCGAGTPKAKNPNIPISPVELANDAYECYKAGAAVVHLHMRDDEGLRGKADEVKFKETCERIRDKCGDVLINLTTSGQTGETDEMRMAYLYSCKPEMASFNPGSINWMASKRIYENHPLFMEKLAKCMMELDILPEMEIFDSGMLHNVEWLVENGLVTRKLRIQYVLGILGGATARIDDLLYLKNQMNLPCTWSALGIGKNHLPILLATLALDGDLRVGLEDNIYYNHGVLATNRMLVERAVRLASECGKEIASPKEAREIMGINR